MERLTERKCGGYGLVDGCKLDTLAGAKKVIDRLAAYEDTGLEPGPLDEMQNEAYDLGYQSCLNYKGLGWTEAEELQRYREIGTVDRLQELAQAEKDGRLVVLPVPVGSTVYALFCGEVIEKRIGKFIVNNYTRPKLWAEFDCDFTINHMKRWDLAVGKTIFLTKEEAVAALEGKVNEKI